MAVKLINTGGAVKLTVPNTDALKEEIKDLQAENERLEQVAVDSYMNGFSDGEANGLERGKAEGFAEGQAQGYEEGKQAEYDAFWDGYQDNGNRKNYQYAFCERGWNAETLKPKYMMVTSTGERMFYRCNWAGKTRLDMTEVCKKLDTSQATSALYMFADAFLENVTVDLGNATTLNTCFASGNIGANKSIKNVTLKVTENCTAFTNAFRYCNATEEIIFTDDSVIASDGMNLQWSKNLNKASIESIINALSTTTSGLTVTLSETAVNNAFSAEEWEALRNTKKNWTVTLI